MTTLTSRRKNSAMSRIFSRPILANVLEPHPKSPVVRPDFMLKVLISFLMSDLSKRSSIAPTM